MAMTSSQAPPNPLKRKMEAPAFPPKRNSPQTNFNGTNRTSSNNGTSPTNGPTNHARSTSTGAVVGTAHDRRSSIHDRTGPNGRKAVPPAYAVGKGNQNERELPPAAYMLAISPVAIPGDYKRMKQLPLGLILRIVGFVSVLFILSEGQRAEMGAWA